MDVLPVNAHEPGQHAKSPVDTVDVGYEGVAALSLVLALADVFDVPFVFATFSAIVLLSSVRLIDGGSENAHKVILAMTVQPIQERTHHKVPVLVLDGAPQRLPRSCCHDGR